MPSPLPSPSCLDGYCPPSPPPAPTPRPTLEAIPSQLADTTGSTQLHQVMNQVSDAAVSFLLSPVMQLLLACLFVFLVIAWFSKAWWVFRDMHERTEWRVLPYLMSAMIVLSTPFLFPLALYIYRTIRPQELLAEVYERNLAMEALLAEAESILTCRNCDKRVNAEWLICPWCRTRLQRVCPNCDKPVGLDWQLCAWCAKDFSRPDPSQPEVAASPAIAAKAARRPARKTMASDV